MGGTGATEENKRVYVMRRRQLWMIFTGILFAATLTLAQSRTGSPLRRARPPRWEPRDIEGIFFEDAFEQGLVGERPSHLLTGQPRPKNAPRSDTSLPEGYSSPNVSAWSKIISAETIEDEVQTIKLEIDKVVTTPQRFAGGGYVLARRHFSVLALLFGVINEYDGDVRWKADSAAARDLFAHAASVTKAGSLQVFQTAKACKSDLQDLVGGAKLGHAPNQSTSDWGQVADRVPLMQRLELAHQTRLSKWTANESEFAKRKSSIVHEAAITAAIAETLTREGMDDAVDDEYAAYCQRIKEAAQKIIHSVRIENYPTAREAAGEMSKACSECHELYRA